MFFEIWHIHGIILPCHHQVQVLQQVHGLQLVPEVQQLLQHQGYHALPGETCKGSF